MKKSLVAAAVAVTLGSLAGFAAAQVKPEIMVKQRQSAMTLIGKYWGPIAGMASGKVSPYNADVISRNATYLENLAQMPWDGFHDSTKDEKNTKALPEIWSQKAKFDELAQRLQTETAKLGEVARKKDEAGVKQQYAAVGKVCGACHEGFRAK
ncbi:MAG TPA: cytochrome c [Burkholderiales bacterium]|jgi:cytochrome c556|nr:cytochrome c [Burkholderiales bacterium]